MNKFVVLFNDLFYECQSINAKKSIESIIAFAKYVLENYNKKDIIIKNVEAINNCTIDEIDLCENFDFCGEYINNIKRMCAYITDGKQVFYHDETSLEEGVYPFRIEKNSNANYLITIRPYWYPTEESRSIKVNNLIFESKLPNSNEELEQMLYHSMPGQEYDDLNKKIFQLSKDYNQAKIVKDFLTKIRSWMPEDKETVTFEEIYELINSYNKSQITDIAKDLKISNQKVKSLLRKEELNKN